jgi:hypothetical protein
MVDLPLMRRPFLLTSTHVCVWLALAVEAEASQDEKADSMPAEVMGSRS